MNIGIKKYGDWTSKHLYSVGQACLEYYSSISWQKKQWNLISVYMGIWLDRLTNASRDMILIAALDK